MARGFNYAPGASDDVTLAASGDLTRAQAQALAGSRNAVVRETVASRTDVPLGTLVGLAHDRSAEVRAAVAANATATGSVLEHLSGDRQVSVLHALLGNPALGTEVIERLAFHRKEEVRAHAVRRLDAPASTPGPAATGARAPEIADVVELHAAQERPTRTAPVRGFRTP